ncbi:MAG: methyltransferase domain-containing protein [bacterium]|nr:methyltransferase domain-containing protein [bacterium]
MHKFNQYLESVYEQFDHEVFLECEQAKQNWQSCADCHRNSYFPGGTPQYQCSEFREMYLMRSLGVHLDEICSVFTGLQAKAPFSERGNTSFKVLSIGGGPGSDVTGLQRFIKVNESFFGRKSAKFKVTRVEMEPTWDDQYAEVVNLIESPGFQFKFENHHLSFEGFRPESEGYYDVITLSYVLSELDSSQIANLTKLINDSLAPGGLLVINERPEEKWVTQVHSMLEAVNLNPAFETDKRKKTGLFIPNLMTIKPSPKRYLNSYRLGAIKGGG